MGLWCCCFLGVRSRVCVYVCVCVYWAGGGGGGAFSVVGVLVWFGGGVVVFTEKHPFFSSFSSFRRYC